MESRWWRAGTWAHTGLELVLHAGQFWYKAHSKRPHCPPSQPAVVMGSLPLSRGLILQDLTFVHLGNPDYVDGKVNFSKRWQQFNILDSMRCFQQA